MLLKNRYYNVIHNLITNNAKYLLRDFQEIRFIKNLEKREEFFLKLFKKMSLTFQQELLLKNSGVGIYFNNQLAKTSQNSQFWNITLVDDYENFVHFIPLWGMHIQLVEKTSEKFNTLFSYFYMPTTDETWLFGEDFGALYNQQKLHQMPEPLKNNGRILGSDLLMLHFFVAGKVKECTFKETNELQKSLIEFILKLTHKNLKFSNNSVHCF